ncbi:hypothetical protein QUA97_12765, partial [Microcoleus sp. CZ3-B2]
RGGEGERGRLGDWESGRGGEGEIGRLGEWERGRGGEGERGRLGKILLLPSNLNIHPLHTSITSLTSATQSVAELPRSKIENLKYKISNPLTDVTMYAKLYITLTY